MSAATMPAIFFGHGNPMNAIQHNAWTAAWANIGRSIPRPKAILAISAHWYLPGTMVTAMASTKTIHDFGGLPPELFALRYPAPGDVALAGRVEEDITWNWKFTPTTDNHARITTICTTVTPPPQSD